jgi:ligand-binding sensor domain-containing protein
MRVTYALNPSKALTQYTRTTWAQKDGLPEDMVKTIVQTSDGYLWLGTDEGLARFDGYDFKLFTKEKGDLPSNSITKLVAGNDGSLWIGTANGVAKYSNERFHNYAGTDGLPSTAIADLCLDHTGTVWIVSGGSVTAFDGKRTTVFEVGKDIPFVARSVYEDRRHVIWVAGFGAAYRVAGKFVPIVSAATLGGNLVTSLAGDRHDNLWMGGSVGVVQRSPDGKVRKFDAREGLSNAIVTSLAVDSKDVLWIGTDSGVARLENRRFSNLANEDGPNRSVTHCVYEDREGDLWVGTNHGLIRFRDDIFTSYGRSEGLPGDDPSVLYQDHGGHIWIGFRNSGLMLFSPPANEVFSTRDGLPSNEVYSIRETPTGDLLIGMRGGLVRLHGSQFSTYRPTEGRTLVFDSLEDSAGKLWLATQSGLGELRAGHFRIVVPGGPLIQDLVVSLSEGRDGVLWAGTPGNGLWRIDGESTRRFSTKDGLSSDQIYSLYHDDEGTLWIATFGGGLNALRSDKFEHFTAKDGLLSDNISHITDDGKSFWLSTTRGICRISKQQLRGFSEHEIPSLRPTNYGVEDGLGSPQLAPGYIAGGGSRTSDGRLWFPTTRGLAAINPNESQRRQSAPAVALVDVAVDGTTVDSSSSPQLRRGSEQIRFRYSAIHLSAPERIQYFHKLVGLNREWVSDGRQHQITYNSLPHGKYRFLVRAEMPGGEPGESSYDFEILPKFYETTWFRLLCAIAVVTATWGIYRLRLRRLRHWFSLVLEERTRLAREIHDTLAQGFIGLSAQLDAVAVALPQDVNQATRDLALAQRMARYGITEARRAVIDLRASVLEEQDLGSALQSGVQIWTVGAGVAADIEVAEIEAAIPEEVQRHLLRITQEAVTNVVKHAQASRISVTLKMEERKLHMRIVDNGRGFEVEDALSPTDGHFGLIGMQERAERIGGVFRLTSRPGEGTKVEVTVMLT